MRASGKVVALDVSSAKTDIAERLMSAYFDALSIPDSAKRHVALAKWAMKADRYKRRFIRS
ncbi:hypothetical protein [Neptuniibacter pectenicola]|jgi:hypothetical protein|uniref:hypothetical protein n=1 Tax=Neptuniibacter pectenicola TaxID=1806669 RepID=UPI000835A180|nr:hypothetical protein [Neptuniibacter pectenicola]